MNTTNKKIYLVEKDEFNEKVCALEIYVSYLGKSGVFMFCKVNIFKYMTAIKYFNSDFVEFEITDNESAKYVEENFKGRWAE